MPSTHVIIRGHVFTYAEKEPFAASGHSVLGALEYDEATERTKCHECGGWATNLGHHIRTHGLTKVEYNQRYGLRLKSPLTAPGKRRSLQEKTARTKTRNGTAGCAANKHKLARPVPTYSADSHNEARNERNRCTAQLIFRILTTAAQVGKTPSATDLRAAGMQVELIERRFGNLTKAMLACGLLPNVVGAVPGHGDRRKDLPADFPTELEKLKARAAKWEEPMPWPKEHLDVGIIALQQRRG